MATLMNLVARDSYDESYSPTMAALLIALVVLLIIALLCIIALYFMRWRKRSLRADSLPFDEEKSSSARSSRHHRVTVRPHESIIVYQEKQSLINNPFQKTSLLTRRASRIVSSRSTSRG